ncbi:hypothetical protein KJ359_001658 [Pestalotiopsis sp. 9143b]|nr:hypothetical protein KJ359_001658 [Pestalotiopsis sp. 9143b]
MPQLLVTVIYLFYNSMLSTFLVQREFSLMHKPEKRKPLRVSEPMGIQRSSYFISLPLRYGIPLYATSGLMHWLVSQSLFLARITAVDPDGQDDRLGARTYDGTMSMVSTNSRAISAACHALEGDRENGYLLPVQWGVVQVKGDVGRCAFTTAPDHELQKLRNLRRDLKFM